MSKITEEIPAEAFEVVRDRLVQILRDEIAEQAVISGDQNADAKVFKERVVPVGYEHTPAVNVMLEKVDYSGQTQLHTVSECLFIIDVYTSGKNGPNNTGDEQTSERGQKIARLIRGILEAPVYKKLDFETNFIQQSKVDTIKVSEPRDFKDSKHMMLVRVNYSCKASNSNVLQAAQELNLSETTVKIDDTELGHTYETTT